MGCETEGTYTCPKCGKNTEVLYESKYDETTGVDAEYMIAERCKPCGWVLEMPPCIDGFE